MSMPYRFIDAEAIDDAKHSVGPPNRFNTTDINADATDLANACTQSNASNTVIDGMDHGPTRHLNPSGNEYDTPVVQGVGDEDSKGNKHSDAKQAEGPAIQYESDDSFIDNSDEVSQRLSRSIRDQLRNGGLCFRTGVAVASLPFNPVHRHLPTCAMNGRDRWTNWIKKRKLQKKRDAASTCKHHQSTTSIRRTLKKRKRETNKSNRPSSKDLWYDWTCHAYKEDPRTANGVQSQGPHTLPRFHLKIAHKKRHLVIQESSSSSSSSSDDDDSCNRKTTS